MVHTASECRYRRKCQPDGFKQRLACAVFHHPEYRAEEIARRAEVRYDWLTRYTRENEDRHIPAEALVKVARVTGRWDLLDELLAGTGYHLAKDTPATVTADTISDELLDVQAAVGQIAAHLREAKRDGKFTDVELDALVALADAGDRQLGELKGALEALRRRGIREVG